MMGKITLSLTLLLTSWSQVFAALPVTDHGSLQQQIKTQVETMAKWQAQYDQMMHQLDQAKQQYEALTGARGLGDIVNNPILHDYLPSDWQKTYDNIRTQGYAGLKGRGAQIYQEAKVFDGCAHIKMEDHRKVCEAQAVKASQDKGFLLDVYDKIDSRMEQIDHLMEQINTTKDPKAIAELQARIAIEQANIQNEHTRLQLYQMIAEAEDRVMTQRQQEIHARTWSARGGVHVEPVKFD